MRNIQIDILLNNYQIYKIVELERPWLANRLKWDILNLRTEPDHAKRVMSNLIDLMREKLPYRYTDKIESYIRSNKSEYIKYRKNEYTDFSRQYLYLSEKALEMLGVSAYEQLINRIGRGVRIENRLLSRSLRAKMQALNVNNSRYLHNIVEYANYMDFEKGTDRNFTIKNDGTMTYLPANKECMLNSDEKWKIKDRQEIKIGKGIRKILSQIAYVDEKMIEDISNKLKEEYTFSAEFKIVEGEDIAKWYHYSQYSTNAGTLNNSCMKHSSCRDYFDIYIHSNVKMLIAVKDGKLHGRALLWDDVNIDSTPINTRINVPRKIKFMDRIYGTDICVEAFKTWAYNNGYYHKERQSYTSRDGIIDPVTKEEIYVDMSVKAKGNWDAYPYMDTFAGCDDINQDDIILKNRDGNHTLTDTNGYVDSEDYVTLGNGERVHIDEANYVERYGEWYISDDTVYVDENDEYELADQCYYLEGQWYHEDSESIVYSDYTGEYILMENAIEIDSIWYPEDADCLRYSDFLGQTVHEDDVVYSESNNDYIPIDEAVECFMTNTWILKSDSIEVVKNDVTYYADSNTYTNEELIEKILSI